MGEKWKNMSAEEREPFAKEEGNALRYLDVL